MAYHDSDDGDTEIKEEAAENITECADDEPCEVREEVLCYEGGIKSFVEYLNSHKHADLIHNDVIYISERADILQLK